MDYVLSKTTNGTTYYAMLGKTNAVSKTEDIHQAKIFDSEASAFTLFSAAWFSHSYKVPNEGDPCVVGIEQQT